MSCIPILLVTMLSLLAGSTVRTVGVEESVAGAVFVSPLRFASDPSCGFGLSDFGRLALQKTTTVSSNVTTANGTAIGFVLGAFIAASWSYADTCDSGLPNALPPTRQLHRGARIWCSILSNSQENQRKARRMWGIEGWWREETAIASSAVCANLCQRSTQKGRFHFFTSLICCRNSPAEQRHFLRARVETASPDPVLPAIHS